MYRDEVHYRVVAAVRRLLTGDVTQSELADLLECDKSSVNRALLLADHGDRHRRREWRAWEVYAIADTYGVPIARFFRD